MIRAVAAAVGVRSRRCCSGGLAVVTVVLAAGVIHHAAGIVHHAAAVILHAAVIHRTAVVHAAVVV